MQIGEKKTTTVVLTAPPAEVTLTSATPIPPMNELENEAPTSKETDVSVASSFVASTDHVDSNVKSGIITKPVSDDTHVSEAPCSDASSHASRPSEQTAESGSVGSTASPSLVSMRYSLTPGTNAEHPDMAATQV